MGFKIKYNSADVDRSKSGGGVPPNPGIYLGTIKGVKYRKDNDDIEFIVRIKTGDHKGYGFWDYVNQGEASAWKMDQYITAALGIDTVKKPQGTLDIDDFLNKDVMMRVKAGSYQGLPKPDLAAVLPVPSDFDEDEEDPADDGDPDDPADDGEPEADPADDPDDPDADPDEPASDEDDFDTLGEEADNGDAVSINRLTELAGENDLDPDEYDTWAELALALEEALSEPEPTPAPAKKATAKKAAPAPKAAAKKKAKDYDEMDPDDLKAECTTRGISAKGNKSAIIARLRANDDDPFSD